MSRAKKISLAVHAWNEADALKRLVLSSLPLADLIEEWVVLDHRSTDHTPQVIEELRELCRANGIGFKTWREGRDFQPGFLFADLRQSVVDACKKGAVVWVVDADYVLGPRARVVIKKALAVLTAPASRYYGLAFSRPVIWDHVRTDENGAITEHGRVWLHAIHKGRVEIMVRGAVKYRQVGANGKWERPVPTTVRRSKRFNLTPKRSIEGIEDVVVSLNIKPAERIELRRTMTLFQRALIQGKLSGTWLQEYEAGNVEKMDPYKYDNVDLRGWKTNLPNLHLTA